MPRRLVLLLAVTCGVSVGIVYFPQAITPLVASGLNVSPDSAALVMTATQLGYATGLFLLVPLGDRVSYRPLITSLCGITGLGLLTAGIAPNLGILLAANVLIGLTTVIGPIIGVMAAAQVDEDRRGAVTGTLLSGSICGMLVSRTFGGALGEWLGWRAPYLASAALTLLLTVVLAMAVPKTSPTSQQRYPALIVESLRLLRTEPDLRRSCFYQATIFAGFHAVGTAVAFLLTGPVYGFGAQAVGLLSLVGVATMFCTPIAGRQADRLGPGPVNLVCMFGALAAAVILTAGALGGLAGVVALVVGTLVLDVAMQCGMVANLTRIFALRPEIRSRLNTAYMTCGYLGGSLGSSLSGHAYGDFGWTVVCGLLALLAILAIAYHLFNRPHYGTRSASETSGVDGTA